MSLWLRLSIPIAALVAFAPALALAAPPEVNLQYERSSGAEACPAVDELRASVAARLGYDPIVTRNDVDTIRVRIRPVHGKLEGVIERLSRQQQRGARPTTITSKSSDCVELASALAVGIAIAIDPLSITREPPAPLPPLPTPPPPAPAPVPIARTESPREERAPEPPREMPTHLRLGVGPAMAIGALPNPSFGVRAMAGVSRGLFEIDLEGRFDPPVELQTGAATVGASLALASLVPCARYRFAFACAQFSAGALRGTGLGFDRSREDNTFYLATGARLGAELFLGHHTSVRLAVEGQIPLRPTRLEADGATVWSTPTFAVAAVPMLVGRFP